jgi:hypothetical protein
MKVIIFIITIGFHLTSMFAIRKAGSSKRVEIDYTSSGKYWSLFIVRKRDTDKETLKNSRSKQLYFFETKRREVRNVRPELSLESEHIFF